MCVLGLPYAGVNPGLVETEEWTWDEPPLAASLDARREEKLQKTKETRMGRLRTAAVAMLAVLLTAPAAAETEFFVAPAADFRTTHGPSGESDFDVEGGYTEARGCALAPANLPHGSTVTSLTGYLRDTDPSFDTTLTLKRSDGAELASVTSSGASPLVVPLLDVSISFPSIDLESFSYFLAFCSDIFDLRNHRLYAARVGYTPAAGVEAVPIVVPGAAFRGHTISEGRHSIFFGFVWAGYDVPGCLAAPVYLDVGDVITGVSADVVDNDDTNDFTVQLRRHSVTDPNAGWTVVANINTSGASPTKRRISAPTIFEPLVDTDLYVYYLTTTSQCLTFDDKHRIHNVRIETALLFADGFESGDTSAWAASGRGASLPGPRIRQVSGAAIFTEDETANENFGDYRFEPNGGYVVPDHVVGGDPVVRCSMAPVQLPQGATIIRMDGALYDATTATNLTVNLRRKMYANTTDGVPIGTLQTSGSGGMSYPAVTVSQPNVDNMRYTYYVEVCNTTLLPVGHTLLRIYDVRFTFTQ